jgi:hypothetical protein
MRLKLLLPQVEPSVFEEPSVCPYDKCGGKQFHLRQEVRKPVRDTVFHEVTARRHGPVKVLKHRAGPMSLARRRRNAGGRPECSTSPGSARH